jgi:hypothetical protein
MNVSSISPSTKCLYTVVTLSAITVLALGIVGQIQGGDFGGTTSIVMMSMGGGVLFIEMIQCCRMQPLKENARYKDFSRQAQPAVGCDKGTIAWITVGELKNFVFYKDMTFPVLDEQLSVETQMIGYEKNSTFCFLWKNNKPVIMCRTSQGVEVVLDADNTEINKMGNTFTLVDTTQNIDEEFTWGLTDETIDAWMQRKSKTA